MMSGLIPCASNARITPIWAKPRAAPLPSTSPMEGPPRLTSTFPASTVLTSILLTRSSRLIHIPPQRDRQQLESQDMVKVTASQLEPGFSAQFRSTDPVAGGL